MIFNLQIIRPATVCGYSPRARFDLSVSVADYARSHKRQDNRIWVQVDPAQYSYEKHDRCLSEFFGQV